MSYSFAGHTVKIGSSGTFYLLKRGTETTLVTIDLNHKDAKLVSDQTSVVTVGEEDPGNMGVVVDTTPLQANQVSLTTQGELCKSPQSCLDIKDKTVLIHLDNGTLEVGYPQDPN